MVKCEILEEGEQALLYRYNGKITLEKGPKRMWLFASKLERLQRYIANHDEFLIIKHKDGSTEHKIGPCTEFLNTLNYIKIQVEKCYCLDANQAIIVYKKGNQKESFNIKITYGPGIFMLQPDEWVHKFSWHGHEDDSKTRYVADKNKFEILNFAPNQLYYNVDEVRTSDDALIRIKLMIFYELRSIETMLNETKDPIADLLNCCCADVIAFTSKKTYLNFIESCYQLNELKEYNKLTERANNIGFEITKVVFRGYFASPVLQTLHDGSIQARTKLKLQYESELQAQEQIDLNLKNEMSRLTSEQELELQKLINQQELEKLKIQNSLNLKLFDVTKRIELQKELKLKELEILSKNNQQKLEHLEKLKDFNIDLTEYLLASISKPDKLVQIVNKNQNLHLNDAGQKPTVKDSNKNSINPSASFANIHFHE